MNNNLEHPTTRIAKSSRIVIPGLIMTTIPTLFLILINRISDCLKSCKDFNRDLNVINKFVVSHNENTN